jgi:glycerol-3-phosphate dehydrogenase (NAD(P)+)
VKRIAVLGAGAWGTSIATVLAARLEVVLWARDPAQAEALGRTRRNERYLPGIEIPSAVKLSSDFSDVLSTELLLVATPVSGLRAIVKQIDRRTALVWLCKGFEQDTGLLPHQIVEQTLGAGARCGALSGPSFAEEVARGLPCALTLAAR